MKNFELKGKALVNGELTENLTNDSNKNKWVELGESIIKLNRKENELHEQWFKNRCHL